MLFLLQPGRYAQIIAKVVCVANLLMLDYRLSFLIFSCRFYQLSSLDQLLSLCCQIFQFMHKILLVAFYGSSCVQRCILISFSCRYGSRKLLLLCSWNFRSAWSLCMYRSSLNKMEDPSQNLHDVCKRRLWQAANAEEEQLGFAEA